MRSKTGTRFASDSREPPTVWAEASFLTFRKPNISASGGRACHSLEDLVTFEMDGHTLPACHVMASYHRLIKFRTTPYRPTKRPPAALGPWTSLTCRCQRPQRHKSARPRFSAVLWRRLYERLSHILYLGIYIEQCTTKHTSFANV